MTRVLTVDDSRAIRNIVQKQLVECGFDVDEAEDGEKGLAALEECHYDLVVLDVTMPVLDGPGMLARMREAGVKTPVLMLTSESKRTIIAGCLKLGIDDYILKPFKPEELRAKVLKALGKPEAPAAGPVAPAVMAAPAAEPGAAPPPFVDVLVVDDMENVQRKLRTLVPAHLVLHAAASAQAALGACRERVCRVILVDSDIPDVNSHALMNQLRALQPHAAMVAMPLRSANDLAREAREGGFDGVLAKPFQVEEVDDFLLKYFDNQDLVSVEDNVLRAGAYSGKEERVERYYARLVELSRPALEKIAAACHDELILDLAALPLRAERVARAVLEIEKHARQLGLSVKVAGPSELGKLLTGFTETAAMPFFASVGAARAA